MLIFVVTCHDSNDGQHDAGIGQGLPGYCSRIITLLMEGGVHQVGALHNNVERAKEINLAISFVDPELGLDPAWIRIQLDQWIRIVWIRILIWIPGKPIA
jgi:hypothetical protein